MFDWIWIWMDGASQEVSAEFSSPLIVKIRQNMYSCWWKQSPFHQLAPKFHSHHQSSTSVHTSKIFHISKDLKRQTIPPFFSNPTQPFLCPLGCLDAPRNTLQRRLHRDGWSMTWGVLIAIKWAPRLSDPWFEFQPYIYNPDLIHWKILYIYIYI